VGICTITNQTKYLLLLTVIILILDIIIQEYSAGNRAHPTGVIPLDNIDITMYTDEQSKKQTDMLHGWEVKHKENKRVFVLAANNEEEKLEWCDLLNKATGVSKARNLTASKTAPKISELALKKIKSLGGVQRVNPGKKEIESISEENEKDGKESPTDFPKREMSDADINVDDDSAKSPSSLAKSKSQWSSRKPKKVN